MMKRVVIVGGGCAGLNAAKGLANARDIEVTLLDERNHHLFQPLLYQVATAGLSPAEIAAPIRGILSHARNIRVLRERALDVDLFRRVVVSDSCEHPYDCVVLACGSKHAYFGNEEWEVHAPGLKTLEQATEIRRRVLTAFEEAEKEAKPELKRALLTFVIVGGGPTGVELAGAIGEMSRFTLARDFRHIDPTLARVILVEAGPRILPTFDKNLAGRAARDLESLGVQIWSESLVTNIDADGLDIGTERLPCRTVLWAAGVKASSLGQRLGADLDRQGGVIVGLDLSLPGHPEGGVHRRRSGARARTGRESPARNGARRAPARSIPRKAHSNDGAWRQPSGLSLSRQGTDGHDRSTSRNPAVGKNQVRRICGVDVLAAHPHLLSRRIQESLIRRSSMGLVVCQLRPRRAPDRRKGLALLR